MDTVRIRLRKPNRVVRFLCSNVTIERGERCVARSERGLEYGVCVAPPQHCPDEIARQINAKVIRKATEEDETAFQRLVEEEAGAQQVCLEMIRERDLPMKVVETEFTFDRKRVCFYFTADQRVDFRQLVRDLAHRLHMRIELRHIQVRDQAKMVGGIGECGRVLCCQGWLRDFM
ncbi:MAG TPA: stage 0 sporulation protein, partial [Candidatus Hydrogenedentes bacterium]|nr:stage 0 sporulation protein [Candidatus Hydrogenedentota bacterium]